jgi:predicted secreted protein
MLAISGVVLVAADSLKLRAETNAPNPTTATAAVAPAMCLMLMTTRFS